MPETRNNKYREVQIPVDFTTGGVCHVKMHSCKKCGALVVDLKEHDKWHRDLEPSWK